jgi:hypothetical protein
MKKREKIILAVMGVALLGAAYILLSDRSSPQTNVVTEQNLASVKAFSAQLTEDLKKDILTGPDRYVLERAEAEWASDPFLAKKLSSAVETAGGAVGGEPANFAYSGYLEAGRKRLAIINGMEYQVGEQLEPGGYIVLSIDPERVILEDIGKHGQITLPFTGEIF